MKGGYSRMDNQKKEVGFSTIIDGVRYVFDTKMLLKSDGSPFFSKKEAIKVREELFSGDGEKSSDWRYWRYPNIMDSDETIEKRYNTPSDELWRFPTMAEMKAIFGMTSFRLANPCELDGAYFASQLGVDTHMGCELINGATRHVTNDEGFFLWTDPIKSSGYVRIMDDKVEFHNHSKTDDIPKGVGVKKIASEDDNYDNDEYSNPPVSYGNCIILIRTEEVGHETSLRISDPDFVVSRYDDESYDG